MNQDKIGKFIKDIRMQRNLTQKDLASVLGVTYQAVSKWENGKNIPDIAILKTISEKFNVNIDDILSGEKKKQVKNKYILFFSIVFLLFLILIIVLFILVSKERDFEFKMISTTCDNFNISGSVAYNNDKSSLFISTVGYCGEKDETIYESIECILYEEYKNTKRLVSNCSVVGNNETLEEFLKDVKINVESYKAVCKEFETAKMSLEIKALVESGKIITYVIPITLTDNC